MCTAVQGGGGVQEEGGCTRGGCTRGGCTSVRAAVCVQMLVFVILLCASGAFARCAQVCVHKCVHECFQVCVCVSARVWEYSCVCVCI